MTAKPTSKVGGAVERLTNWRAVEPIGDTNYGWRVFADDVDRGVIVLATRLTEPIARLIAAAPTLKAENESLREINAALLKALAELLPVAEQFERQASKGCGSRRGGRTFTKARAALATAKGEAS